MVFFISPDILDPNQDNSCCYLVSFILIFFPTNVLSTFPYYSHRAVDVVNVSRSVNLSIRAPEEGELYPKYLQNNCPCVCMYVRPPVIECGVIILFLNIFSFHRYYQLL
jgi:hypothetical protein